MARQPEPAPDAREGTNHGRSGPGYEELRLELSADAASASIVRQRLHRWLNECGWMPDECDDVILAVHEAVANVIDHAYRDQEQGLVRVAARVTFLAHTRARVQVVVRDWGRWRTPATDSGYRGHGVTVIRGCMDSVEIVRGADGTQVRMESAVVALSAPLLRVLPTAGSFQLHVALPPSTPPGSARAAISAGSGQRPPEIGELHRRAQKARRQAGRLVRQAHDLLLIAQAVYLRSVARPTPGRSCPAQ